MPFAGYENFADCVAKNQDKEDPEGYCAAIQRQVEGDGKTEEASQQLTIAFDGLKRTDGLVAGYANTPVVDLGDTKTRDLIPAELWLGALQAFFKGGSVINFMHQPLQAGETVRVEVSAKGPYLVSRPHAWVKRLIDRGAIQGYSIEYKLYDFDLLPSPDMDPRPIRRFKRFDVVRISYVDQPMNQGSYFGGKMIDLSRLHFTFDKEAGTLQVAAADEEAFAEISQMFAGLIQEAHAPGDVKFIQFKMSDQAPVPDTPLTAPEVKGIRALLGAFSRRAPQEEVDMTKEELTVQLDAFKTSIDGLKERLDALEPSAEQAEQLKNVITKFGELFPKEDDEGGKSVVDRIGDLEQATADESPLMKRLGQVEEALDRITGYLESQQGKARSQAPISTKSETQREEDFWGPQN